MPGAGRSSRLPRTTPTAEDLADIQKGGYLSVKAFANHFECCPNWVLTLIRQGRIRAIKIGNRWKIPPEEAAWIIEHGVPNTPPDDKQPPINVIRVPADIRDKMVAGRRKLQEDPPSSELSPEPSPEPKKNPYWPFPFKL